MKLANDGSFLELALGLVSAHLDADVETKCDKQEHDDAEGEQYPIRDANGCIILEPALLLAFPICILVASCQEATASLKLRDKELGRLEGIEIVVLLLIDVRFQLYLVASLQHNLKHFFFFFLLLRNLFSKAVDIKWILLIQLF